MKKSRWRNVLLVLLFCQISHVAVSQILISVFGDWNYTIPVNNLTEAGLDFTGTYSSNANQVTIDVSHQNFISNLFGNYSWKVDIKRADIDWHPNLQIYAKRTGTGNNGSWFGSSVSNGNSYQLLSISNQQFFNGSGTRRGIPIQYQIRNVSLLLPAKTYETTIIYTITAQ